MRYATPWSKVLALVLLFFCVMSMVGMDIQIINDTFRDGKFRWMLFGLVVLFVHRLWDMNPAWALFAGWNAFRWIMHNYESFGVVDLMAVPGCLILGNEMRKAFRDAVVARLIAFIAFVEGLHGFLQTRGIDPIGALGVVPLNDLEPAFRKVAIGTMGHYTVLGPLVALGAVYFLSRKLSHWIYPVLFVVSCYFVYLCNSTMTVLSLAAGCAYLLWRWKPMLAVGSSLAGAFGLSVWYHLQPRADFFDFSGRWEIWGKAVDAWLLSPIVGHGPGSWFGMLSLWKADHTHGWGNWEQVHFDFLQVLPEQGAIGLVIVLVGVGLLLWKAQKMCPIYGAWITVLSVNACGNFIMHIVTFGIVAGWLASAVHNHQLGELHGYRPNKFKRRR